MKKTFRYLTFCLIVVTFCGCTTIKKLVPGEDKIKSPDEVNFAELVWDKGGENGSKAVLTEALIKDFKLDSNKLSYNWVDKNMSIWGYAYTQADGRTCVFYKKNGKWHGGFFEWISSSRKTRDFKNIKTKYKGWDWNDIPNGSDAVLVIISRDGKKRTNTLKGKWVK